MINFLTDENIDPALLNQLRRHLPEIDVIDVRDVGLDSTPDPVILQWAADNGRVLITHDVNLMRGFANQRVEAGLPMPGVILVPEGVPFGPTIQGIIWHAVEQFSYIENQAVFVTAPQRTLP